MSGVKGRPKEAYFGAVGGGLWKTVDGGVTWTPVTDGQIKSSSVGAVAVAETNPDIVFIGMGESCIRGNIMPGDGVYKSTDAGKTWTHVGFSGSQAISRVRIHPTNPDIVFVASFGKYGAPSDERGIYKSTDGGKTWQRKLFRDAKTGAVDLAIDRRNPNVMYASLWEAYRVEYQMSSGGPGSGLFKSTDGGDTWTEITRNTGLPAGVVGRIGVAVSGADSNRVYALVENENGGLFSSDDAGKTWALINSNRNIRQRAFYYTHVAADPVNRDTVYMLNVSLYRSTDGGKTMTALGGSHSDHHDLWIDPDDPKHLVLGNDGGGAVSFSSGQPVGQGPPQRRRGRPRISRRRSITTRRQPATCPITCAAPSRTAARSACRATPTSAGVAAPAAVVVDEAHAPALYSPGGAEPGYVAPDPLNPDIFYAGGNNGSFLTRLDRRTERSTRSQSVSAHVLRRAVERARRTLAVDVPDHLLARRSDRALHLVAARVEDDQRRSALGQNQPRPHASRSEDDGSVRRANHQGHERAGSLRHGLRDRTWQEGRQHHLGRIGRRPDTGHA